MGAVGSRYKSQYIIYYNIKNCNSFFAFFSKTNAGNSLQIGRFVLIPISPENRKKRHKIVPFSLIIFSFSQVSSAAALTQKRLSSTKSRNADQIRQKLRPLKSERSYCRRSQRNSSFLLLRRNAPVLPAFP